MTLTIVVAPETASVTVVVVQMLPGKHSTHSSVDSRPDTNEIVPSGQTVSTPATQNDPSGQL
jgi:hypothetical protein